MKAFFWVLTFLLLASMALATIYSQEYSNIDYFNGVGASYVLTSSEELLRYDVTRQSIGSTSGSVYNETNVFIVGDSKINLSSTNSDFEFRFAFNVSSGSTGSSSCIAPLVTLSSNTGSPRGSQQAIGMRFTADKRGSNDCDISKYELKSCVGNGCGGENTVGIIEDSVPGYFPPLRYFSIKRVGNNLSMSVYSDYNRTNLIGSVSGNWNEFTYKASGLAKYIYTVAVWDDGGSSSIKGSVGQVELCSPNCEDEWFNSPPTPTNGQIVNSNVTISVNCQNRTYYLWLDQNVNPSSLVVNNVSDSVVYTSSVGSDGTYYYKAQCFGDDFNSSVRSFVVDTIIPTITLNSNNGFTSLGFSNINQYGNILPLNITFADELLLYAYKINITKDGTSYFDVLNTTINQMSANYTNNLDISSWPEGTYTISLWAIDGHHYEGGYQISDYLVNEKKDEIKFVTSENAEVSVKCEEAIKTSYEREKNSYSFKFDFEKALSSRTCYVTANKGRISYIDHPKYNAWFVILNPDGTHGNWVDFEGLGTNYIVTKTKGLEQYQVYFYDLEPSKELMTRSIGGVNVRNVNYTWYRGYLSESHADTSLVSSSEPFLLNISLGGSVKNVSASLGYGFEIVSLSRVDTQEMVFFSADVVTGTDSKVYNTTWYVGVVQSDDSTYNFTISGEQELVNLSIDMCEKFLIKTLNFQINNEDYPDKLLNTSFEATLNYIFKRQVVQNINNFSVIIPSTNNVTFCINDTFGDITADAIVRYVSPEGVTNRWYLNDVTLTSDLQTIIIYNFNYSEGLSNLRLQTIDNNYEPITSALVHMQRYYPGEGIWRTVQVDKSDESGYTIFHIKQRIEEYRFSIYYEGTLLKSTDGLKFVCAGDCSLQIITSLAKPSSLDTFSWNAYYDSMNFMYYLDFSDTSGRTPMMTMQIFDGGLVPVTWCSVSMTGASGRLSCNASSYPEGTYFVTGYASYSPNVALFEKSFFKPFSETLLKVSGFVGKAEGAFWAGIIVAVTALSGVVSPFAVIFSGIVGLILVGLIQLGGFVTNGFIILAVVIGIIISVITEKR